MNPTTIAAFGGAVIALASLLLHFTPRFTVAGRIATWLEDHGQELEQVVQLAAAATTTAKASTTK